jgi:hypothetical protein
LPFDSRGFACVPFRLHFRGFRVWAVAVPLQVRNFSCRAFSHDIPSDAAIDSDISGLPQISSRK